MSFLPYVYVTGTACQNLGKSLIFGPEQMIQKTSTVRLAVQRVALCVLASGIFHQLHAHAQYASAIQIVASRPAGVPDGQRHYGAYYSAERIANVRNNCNRFEWARLLKEEAIKKAEPWLKTDDEALWAMVPGQDLPRCIDVTMDRLKPGSKPPGCLKCSDEIRRFGNYPYNPDFRNNPWKLTCPSCKAVFPTNDFGKYYKSGIDDHGLFNPSRADTTLLFNIAHPDPGDPLHKFGVDDGFGYTDENGRSHRFIGYYTWKYWIYLNDGLAALADAFLYSGDKRYAHKAAILLDRIADVYPDMDWKPYADRGWYHSDGGSMLGKIEGCIWENGVVQKFAESYDKILSGTVDSPELFVFLRSQSLKYQLPPKGSRDLFVRNVDQGILHTALNAVISEQIRGNQGMHQLTVAKCALALNTEPHTSQWLEWLFEPDGGAIPGLMISHFDRDGTSNEGAPSYALMWGREITQLATWLESYADYTRNNIFDDYPQFRATFLAAYRMAALGVAIPNIGDSGATGLVTSNLVDPEFMAWGYYFTRDPEIAIAAYRANGNSAKGLGRNIFSEDPDGLSREIEDLAGKAGPRPHGGHMMTGFGLAFLESGTGSHGVALTCNYGRTSMHAHPDMLNFDLFAFGHWLTPDHGYPEFATRWPSNIEWTGSTLSHNTVLVNKQPQKTVWGGHAKIFKQLKGFGMLQLDGKKAYPDLKDYTRTLFLIGDSETDDDNNKTYVVDIFQVNGGDDHLYSFHGPPGDVMQQGLEMQVQEGGTYAGKDIPKGVWAENFPVGYSHLYNVRQDLAPPSTFLLDWDATPGYRGLKEDVHLRLHALNQYDDVALADGDPPQNKPGNPERLGYALMHRSGKNLSSIFVSLVEPYRKEPFIKSVKRLDDGKGNHVALQIEHVDGGVDYLILDLGSGMAVQGIKGIKMNGTAAFVQERDGHVRHAVLVDGTKLKSRDIHLTSSGAITGKVLKMNRELKGGGWLIVDQKLPVDGSLIGQQIMIDPAGERDACYTIRDIRPEGGFTKIFCGPISFVRGYKGGDMVVRRATVPKDYKQGYLYDFEEGASFRISVHEEWKSQAENN